MAARSIVQREDVRCLSCRAQFAVDGYLVKECKAQSVDLSELQMDVYGFPVTAGLNKLSLN